MRDEVTGVTIVRYGAATMLIAVVLMAAMACGEAGQPEADSGESSSGAAASEAAAEDGPREGVPALVDLGSDSCVPCQMMVSDLEELDARTGDALDVRVLDVYENRSVASEYRIRVIPTQIFLSEDGEELYRHEGYMSCDDMLARWEQLGYSFEEE